MVPRLKPRSRDLVVSSATGGDSFSYLAIQRGTPSVAERCQTNRLGCLDAESERAFMGSLSRPVFQSHLRGILRIALQPTSSRWIARLVSSRSHFAAGCVCLSVDQQTHACV
ncbi:unnamed protein product [Ectocarpus sp. 8 AP-2014]